MTRRYTGGLLSATEQITDANTANGIFTLQEAGALTAAGNFPIGRLTSQKSLRFRNSASAFLSRTPIVAGNRKTFTYSVWLKRGLLGPTLQKILECGNTSSDYFTILFNGTGSGSVDDRISLYSNVGGSTALYVESTAQYRDTAAWYHFVFAIDTTQAVSTNRVKIYVNGSQVTALAATTYPSQNVDLPVNNTVAHSIGPGAPTGTSQYFFDGHMAEINLIDGQALPPSYFGFTDPQTGAWVPKQYTGAYGTNGAYLSFNPDYDTSKILAPDFTADFVVVAGGGGGGNGYGSPGPGGGAGGYRTSAGTSGGNESAESSIGIKLSTAYNIIVGAGGAGGGTYGGGITQATKGSVSKFVNIVSVPGGSGYSPGITDSWSPYGLGQGGSGSGGSTTIRGQATLGQGFNGGLSVDGSGGLGSGNGFNQGGGGGASALGGTATGSVAGAGGNGLATTISGSSVTYAGGGAGGNDSARVNGPASGGTGGGGSSVYGGAGNNGTTNTGGGGAGGSNRANAGGSGYPGGNGGSGIIIIKIPNTRTATFSGGVTSSLSTSVAGFKIYTVTATSTTSETVTFS